MGCCRSRARGKSPSTTPAREVSPADTKDLEKGSSECRQWIVEDGDPLFTAIPQASFPRLGVAGRSTNHTPRAKEAEVEPPQDASRVFRNQIEEKLKVVSDLSAKARVFEAHALLEDLLKSPENDVQSEVRSRLLSNPLLSKLQSAYGCLQEGIKATMDPGLRKDVTWTSCAVKDPKIAKDFVLEFSMRMADSSEFEVGGPSSQVIVRGESKNFPASLVHFMLLQAEVDLARKEWIKDCEAIRAWPGGEVQLFRVLVQVLLAPMLLPFRLQETFLRTFSVCETPPFDSGGMGTASSSSSGVLVMEANPPQGQQEYEGWSLPGSAHKRAYSLRGTSKTFYVTPCADPNSVDVIATARVGIPVSPYIVPLELLKRLVAELLRESFARLKEQVIDRWQEYDFDSREAANPGFYEQFRLMHERRSAAG